MPLNAQLLLEERAKNDALERRVAELTTALAELAPCDFDHGWAEDLHSETCRKCAALNSK